MIPTGSRKIVVNAAHIEKMSNGRRVITNPTPEEFKSFMSREIDDPTLPLPHSMALESSESREARSVKDLDRGNTHFAHAYGSVHNDILNHFGIGDNHVLGFMNVDGTARRTIKQRNRKPPTQNAIGFDGKHWPGRGEDEESEDEYRTPAKLFK
jgi:hypothetical protein